MVELIWRAARPIPGYTWLHGLKEGRMVHVGPVDSPISPNDITQIAIEFRKAVGTGEDAPSVAAMDVLGWDFAFELNEVARQQAEQANIQMRFVRIPREVLEQKAVDQGDTFHNMWQAYRTRQDKSLKMKTTRTYQQPGENTIMVKAIDILGNDTTKTLKVKIN